MARAEVKFKLIVIPPASNARGRKIKKNYWSLKKVILNQAKICRPGPLWGPGEYNILTSTSSSIGFKHSDETKKLISEFAAPRIL